MKVLVIGATGATGRIAVDLLLARGDEVTAYARNPAGVTQKSDRLRVATGDARDAAALSKAVEGQDAVLAAFGPRSLKKDDLQEVLMKNLVAAMERHGVKRLVNLSALGAGDSASEAPLVFRIAKALVLGKMFADKDRGEAALFASTLDYVNVRPGRLLDSPARGGVKAARDARGLRASMTRADLAAFMVAQLDSPAWVRASPIIGY